MKDYQEIKQKPDEILKQYFGYDTFYPGHDTLDEDDDDDEDFGWGDSDDD